MLMQLTALTLLPLAFNSAPRTATGVDFDSKCVATSCTLTARPLAGEHFTRYRWVITTTRDTFPTSVPTLTFPVTPGRMYSVTLTAYKAGGQNVRTHTMTAPGPVATIPSLPPRVDTVRLVRVDTLHDTATYVVQVPHPMVKHTGIYIDSTNAPGGLYWVWSFQLMGRIGRVDEKDRLPAFPNRTKAYRVNPDWRPGLEPFSIGWFKWQGNYATPETAASALASAPPDGWPWAP